MSKKQLICAEKIKMSFGEQTILDFDEFHMYEGEKIGSWRFIVKKGYCQENG